MAEKSAITKAPLIATRDLLRGIFDRARLEGRTNPIKNIHDDRESRLIVAYRRGLQPRTYIVKAIIQAPDSSRMKYPLRKDIVHRIERALATMCDMVSHRDHRIHDRFLLSSQSSELRSMSRNKPYGRLLLKLFELWKGNVVSHAVRKRQHLSLF